MAADESKLEALKDQYWRSIQAHQRRQDAEHRETVIGTLCTHRDAIVKLERERDALLKQVTQLDRVRQQHEDTVRDIVNEENEKSAALAQERETKRQVMTGWFHSDAAAAFTILAEMAASHPDYPHPEVPHRPAGPGQFTGVAVVNGKGGFVGKVEGIASRNPTVQALLNLPALRIVHTRHDRPFDEERFLSIYSLRYSYIHGSGTNPSRWVSVMVQGTGIVQPTGKACKNCTAGHGPFEECVVHDGPLFNKCGNCEWSKEPCSLASEDDHPSAVQKTTRPNGKGRITSGARSTFEPSSSSGGPPEVITIPDPVTSPRGAYDSPGGSQNTHRGSQDGLGGSQDGLRDSHGSRRGSYDPFRAPQDAPRYSQSIPRDTQDALRGSYDGLTGSHDGPIGSHDGLLGSHDGLTYSHESLGSYDPPRAPQHTTKYPQNTPRGTRDVPRGSQDGLRGPRDTPGYTRDALRGSHEPFNGSQDGLRERQDPPRYTQNTPKDTQDVFKGSQDPLRGSQNTPKDTQDVFRGSQDPPRGSQDPSRQRHTPRGTQHLHRGSQDVIIPGVATTSPALQREIPEPATATAEEDVPMPSIDDQMSSPEKGNALKGVRVGLSPDLGTPDYLYKRASTLSEPDPITPHTLELRHDGKVYTEPKCVRGVPLEKITSDHPYYADTWAKDVLQDVKNKLQMFRDRVADFKAGPDATQPDIKNKIFMNGRQVNRGERSIAFLEQGPFHPYQLLSKEYIYDGVTNYDTLFRLSETFFELQGYYANRTCLVAPADWIRQRLHEIITQSERANNMLTQDPRKKGISLCQIIGGLYHDPKLKALRALNGKKSVGRPSSTDAARQALINKRKRMSDGENIGEASNAAQGSEAVGTNQRGEALFVTDQQRRASNTNHQKEMGNAAQRRKVSNTEHHREAGNTERRGKQNEKRPGQVKAEPQGQSKNGLPKSAPWYEGVRPVKRHHGFSHQEEDLSYEGFTDVDEYTQGQLFLHDWKLNSVKSRRHTSHPGVTQYWYFRNETRLFEHQVLRDFVTGGSPEWGTLAEPISFGFQGRDVQEIQWAPGSLRVVIKMRRDESRIEEDDFPRGDMIAEIARERTKRRFLVFARTEGIRLNKTTESSINDQWYDMQSPMLAGPDSSDPDDSG